MRAVGRREEGEVGREVLGGASEAEPCETSPPALEPAALEDVSDGSFSPLMMRE